MPTTSKPDLIDRDMRRRYVSDCKFARFTRADVDSAGYAAMDDVLRIIDAAPAVDAEPVRHGRWIEHNDQYENYCECSECLRSPDSLLARAMLPNAVKTEVIATGTIAMWRAFLALRDDPAAHPDMRRLARQFSEMTGIFSPSRR